jgi:predicted RNase H-like HicB family nuclease
MKELVITAELIKEKEGGYTVYCPELDIYTQGENIEDALRNLKEAAELHIEEIEEEIKRTVDWNRIYTNITV